MSRHLVAEPPTITVLGTASKLDKQIGKLKLAGEVAVKTFDRY